MVIKHAFKPINSIIFISINGIETIYPSKITKGKVGEKAYGLSCLPNAWTLPFVVVSDEFLSNYRASNHNLPLLSSLCSNLIEALASINITDGDNIIIRSSGRSEGLEERGKLHSTNGNMDTLLSSLKTAFEKLIKDRELDNYQIPLIIQKHIAAFSSKGHLSNERRFYEHTRDWLGDYEGSGHTFTINLREWRSTVESEKYIATPLKCVSAAYISEILKIPASWASKQSLRVHYEWVWNESNIYIVQADEDLGDTGVDPTTVYQEANIVSNFEPRCLKPVTKDHGKKYHKIANVFIYKELKLPIAKLYILDDQKVIGQLASGNAPAQLLGDIKHLVKSPLVIRMDIDSTDQGKRQLLPRTEERNLEGVLGWLIEQSSNFSDENVVFIFHNFIPAISSAFCYAVPGKRKVQIEALWGLPEGLYYNAHDKIIVDTQSSDSEKMDAEKFSITTFRNYKHFFVSPDGHGNWSTMMLKRPFDWKGSIQNESWIRKIAQDSRRIAELEGRPLSIMWFVNVPTEVCQEQVFPWFHEVFAQKSIARTHQIRYKTPFDQLFIIQTVDDLTVLKAEARKESSNIRYIKIQPNEDQLLRNKKTLYEIGKLAKEMDAVIILEGGILSHAYYQLLQTDAVVEVVHPFKASDDKREFNKLVRDKVPNKIIQGGENVDIAKLTGDSLLKALKDKLIEESFEVLDAVDKDSIVEELADVSEVIDSILISLGVDKNYLTNTQHAKKKKVGGFHDGTVLLETTNPLPEFELTENDQLFDQNNIGSQNSIHEINYADLQSGKIEKLKDRREHNNVVENKITLNIPLVRDGWLFSSSENSYSSDSKAKYQIELKGTRQGSELNLQISVYSKDDEDKQLDLFSKLHK